ncbi:MAG: M48 family metalloprotease [Acidobacteria bacterium]|nr:M48 family metalloprotease [Acidobacteriota bacterium]
MRTVVVAAAIVAIASPAYAQFGALNKGLKRAQQVQDLQITDSEEHQIGAEVSARLRARFGVVQDKEIHKYVTSVGMLLAQESTRASLPWTFIVLDTDGVNAFASPGGFIHVTKGALALIANEAQLAGVLGHEITHVTEKHTINAIRKSKAVQIGADEAGGNKGLLVKAMAGKVYEMVIENSFDRGDEGEADKKGVALAAKAGYAPAGLADFLATLAGRNKGQKERNGLFASHPETQDRIEKIRKDAASLKGSAALVAARYTSHVKYQPIDLTEVPQAGEGAAGLAGGSSSKSGETPKGETKAAQEQPRKKGFGLGSLKRAVAPEGQSAQVSASGGARGVGPDRNANGGPNAALVTVTVTAAELAAFKKGIA